MDPMTALLANYLSREPRAGSLPESARPVLLRLALVAAAIAAACLLLV